MGYDSYDALRDRCRDDLLARSERGPEGPLPNDPLSETDFAAHAAASIRGIEALRRDLDLANLEGAAALLADARRVVLIGDMRARAFVDYATYLSDMSFDGWVGIGRGSVSLAAETRDLGARDAALVVTTTPLCRALDRDRAARGGGRDTADRGDR